MSWDLVLHRPRGSRRLTRREADRALRRVPHLEWHFLPWPMRRGEYPYRNPETTVGFTFHFEKRAYPDEPWPAPFLRFSINFVRPTFFALEAMPIVTQVARRLGLRIVEPGADEALPGQPTAEDLIARWKTYNDKAEAQVLGLPGARVHIGDSARHPRERALGLLREAMARCPRERLTYWWQWMVHHAAVERRFRSDDVFVPPEIFLLVPRNEEIARAALAVGWTMPPYRSVFPEVDYLIMGRGQARGRTPSAAQILGLVPFARVREILGSDLEEFTDPVRGYLYRQRAAPATLEAEIYGLGFQPFDQCARVAPTDVLELPE